MDHIGGFRRVINWLFRDDRGKLFKPYSMIIQLPMILKPSTF